MSLLTIVQSACDRLSLERPSAVVTSTDVNVRTLFGLAQQEGKALASRGTWTVLQAEQTITTTATELQAGAFPADFDYLVPDTMFNRTTRRKVEGPLTQTEWQHTKSSLVVRVNPCFRIIGTGFYITPAPAAGNTIAFEYISRNWCQSASGTGQSAWIADTDTAKIDEELHTLGLVWRFKKSKGLDYGEDFASYESGVAQAIQRDGPKPRIYTDSLGTTRVPTAPQVPDTLVYS